MTKKERNAILQKAQNAVAEREYEKAMAVLQDGISRHKIEWERLDYCNARIGYYDDYWFLESYNTITAFADTDEEVTYDVLRLVYDYTATSAKHFSKFRNRFDYTVITYRAV